jgi:O-antigen/teichoic acid export membrane protein
MLINFQPKTSFAKNALVLLSGTFIAQAISLLMSPIFARIYSPENYGLLSIYIAIVSIFSVIITGRYELALMIPKKERDAVSLLILSFLTSLVLCCIMLLIVVLLKANHLFKLKFFQLDSVLYLIPISIFLSGVYQILYYWANRNKLYKLLSGIHILLAIIVVLLRFYFGFSSFKNFGLIYSYIFSQIIILIIFAFIIFKNDHINIGTIAINSIKSIGKEYINYPKKSALGAFLNTLSYKLEYIIFPIYFLQKEIGLYYFANRLITIPTSMLSTSLWKTFIGENSRKSKSEILKSLEYYQNKLANITTLPFYSSLFVIANLFVFIFSNKWKGGTIYFYPLIISSHINLIVSSFSLFLIINRPDAEMKFNIFLAFLKLSVLITIGFIFRNMFWAIVGISIMQCILFIILGSWNYKQLGQSIPYFSFFYFKKILNISPFLIIFFLVNILFHNWILTTVIILIINTIYIGIIMRK